MTEDQKKWVIAKGRMMDAMKVLGFPEALGDELVKNLGSPNTAPDLVSGDSRCPVDICSESGFEASEESGRIPSYAAMDRMTSYLKNVKPKKAELVVDEMLAVSHIVVNDYECGERTCRRMDMRGRFLIALISQDGEIRKKANGLMQRIMKFFILGLKTCRMTRIKERRKFAHYFCFHDIFP